MKNDQQPHCSSIRTHKHRLIPRAFQKERLSFSRSLARSRFNSLALSRSLSTSLDLSLLLSLSPPLALSLSLSLHLSLSFSISLSPSLYLPLCTLASRLFSSFFSCSLLFRIASDRCVCVCVCERACACVAPSLVDSGLSECPRKVSSIINQADGEAQLSCRGVANCIVCVRPSVCPSAVHSLIVPFYEQ